MDIRELLWRNTPEEYEYRVSELLFSNEEAQIRASLERRIRDGNFCFPIIEKVFPERIIVDQIVSVVEVNEEMKLQWMAENPRSRPVEVDPKASHITSLAARKITPHSDYL